MVGRDGTIQSGADYEIKTDEEVQRRSRKANQGEDVNQDRRKKTVGGIL